MAFEWDPIVAINLVLCVIILALSCWIYRRKKDKVPLYIGISFGLFGISHLATLLDLVKTLESVIVIVRVLAYLTVIFALYTYLKSYQASKETGN